VIKSTEIMVTGAAAPAPDLASITGIA